MSTAQSPELEEFVRTSRKLMCRPTMSLSPPLASRASSPTEILSNVSSFPSRRSSVCSICSFTSSDARSSSGLHLGVRKPSKGHPDPLLRTMWSLQLSLWTMVIGTLVTFYKRQPGLRSFLWGVCVVVLSVVLAGSLLLIVCVSYCCNVNINFRRIGRTLKTGTMVVDD